MKVFLKESFQILGEKIEISCLKWPKPEFTR